LGKLLKQTLRRGLGYMPEWIGTPLSLYRKANIPAGKKFSFRSPRKGRGVRGWHS